METSAIHPAIKWTQDTREASQPAQSSLRLAAMAGHIRLDKVAARRAACITPNSLAAAKLRAYQKSQSTRHLDDIASVVRLQGKKLNQERLDIVAARLNLLGVWRALWAENQKPG